MRPVLDSSMIRSQQSLRHLVVELCTIKDLSFQKLCETPQRFLWQEAQPCTQSPGRVFVKICMPGSDERDIHFPGEIGTEDTNVVESGDMEDVGTKFFELSTYKTGVPLEERIVVQSLVHCERGE